MILHIHIIIIAAIIFHTKNGLYYINFGSFAQTVKEPFEITFLLV